MSMKSLSLNTPPEKNHTRSARALLYGVYGCAAIGVIALHLATNGTLGFHTDELYYLACGRHPALGYVDFPPIVPLLARLETGLLGVTPWTLRLLPSLLGGFLVAISGLYVRRLGGSLRLQGIALLAAVAAPFLLGTNWVFQTVTFDQVTWMVSLYWFLCLIIDRRPRYWIYLGITLGIGLEVKYTIARSHRGDRHRRPSYPFVADGVADEISLDCGRNRPLDLVPESHLADGQWISLTHLHHEPWGSGGPVTYLIEFGVYFFFLIPLWLAGMISLFRSRTLRPIGIACTVPLLLFLFAGKSYYAAGTIPLALAQGLMAISRIKRPRLRSGLQIAVVVSCVLEFAAFFFLVVPVTPPDRIHTLRLDTVNEVFADSVGWNDISNQVTTIYRDLPASERKNTVIISAYYGVPGALQIYGNSKDLPVAISPQLSDFYWLPNNLTATDALMVDYLPSDVAWMCNSPKIIAHLTVPYNVQGLEQGAPVTFCQLKTLIPQIWQRLRNFS